VNALVGEVLAWADGLPLPGSGATAERFDRLRACAAQRPSLGRLVEAHTDAVAILAEADRSAPPGCLGVWAARGAEPVVLERRSGTLRLRGTAPWCSGATVVEGALVTAEADDGAALVLVSLDAHGVQRGEPTWMSPAFAETDTRSVAFDVELDDDAVIGRGGWYVQRPGFWHGAVGVAACWAGCAEGLVGRVVSRWRSDPHATAHLGAIDARLWSITAALAGAAAEIDAAPADVEAAHRRALRIRHVVDSGVEEITQRVQRALGPAPMAMDPDVHLVMAECDLYRRQCHAERDLEALGALYGPSSAQITLPSPSIGCTPQRTDS